MATFTAGPGATLGIDFRDIDLNDFVFGPVDITTTLIRLGTPPTDFVELRGKFALDASGKVAGGTINEIETFENSQTIYEVSGISVSIATLASAWLNDDTEGFLKAVFKANDLLTGSPTDDFMNGYAANDTINGLAGNDTLIGDIGNDSLDGGNDNDSLSGGAGNDTLNGGAGDNNMDGGAGNDTYDVDSTTDLASESGIGAAAGIDTVRSSAATYTLGANIENLTLVEGAGDIGGTGNALANILTGNSGKNELSGDVGNDKLSGGDNSDTLNGDAGNDTLDGGNGDDSLDGGIGDDSMAGGAGNDIYVVDSAKDKVTESLTNDKGGGKDTVESSVSFTLGNNLDDLMLLPSTGRIDGTGNALDNALTGNGNDNKLSGLAGADNIAGGDGNDTLDGGAGKDAMAGGKGDDTYVLDVAVGNDTVTEATDAGKDTVQAAFSIDLTLGAFANIENATLLGTAALSAKGTDADGNFLTGNTGANTLEGGGGNDTLDGGKGNDSLKGGTGDDVYGIDSAKDIVDETGGDGNDTIRSSITVNLASYPDIENVELVGTSAINATGTDGVNNKLTGNAGANKLDGGTGDDTMDGGKGNDTYFVDGAGKDKVSEDDLGGTGGGIDTVISQASFALGLGSNIENLTLLGTALTGTGNELKNIITGNDLGNTLDGGTDVDKLIGGKGDDIYIVDNAKDVVTESTAGLLGGTDTVKSSDSFILGTNVENLILTGNKNSSGTGNALNNEITGDGTSNTLLGLAGNDTLDGGAGNDTLDGGVGIDDLTGGTGNDTYVLDNVNDVFHELAGDISDTVAATFSIDLTNGKYDNIENATLLGTAALTAIGDDGNNYLTGNSGANTLTGGDGLDTLDGKGGVDSLDGGKGSDVYYADNAGEKIFDTGDVKDKDEVRASVTFALGALSTIENAMLLGIAALNLSGNTLDNVLTGNDGANKIDGVDGNDSVAGAGGNDTLTGGTGSDTLAGGKGDDIYVVDGGETILENDKEGIDTVQSAMTYSIAAIANVENLTLTGTGAINGTGNSGNNVITGNSGQNALDGGAGADIMAGGMGNDTYIVDDKDDKVNEAANAGIDTVLSSLHDYTLPANVENLTLTGIGDINGTGNALGNLVTGNDGKNTLDGAAGNDTLAGGLGADTLNGGAGTDTYIYASKDVQDFVNTGDAGGKGADHVSIIGAFDWDVQRDVNDLLIQAAPDEAAANADFDPTQAIRIVDQYAGAGIAFFQGDFGKDNNLFYGDDPNLTTVFTPSGLNGKDQGHNAEVVEGTAGNDTVNGGGGQSDFLYGNDGNDQVNGQSAADESAFLSGGTGNDTLTGAAGADAFRGDEGDDLIDGGAGFDRASYRLATGAVLVDLNLQGTSQAVGADQGNDKLISIEGLSGSKFNDTLIGDSNDNNLVGRDGNDSLSGNGGLDFLAGGAGNDTLRASSLTDFAEAGFDDATTGVIVNLTDVAQGAVAAHTAQDGLGGVDMLINIAGALGGDFADKFFGGKADEFFAPGGGDDTIDGGAGFDDIDYFSSSDAVIASLALQGNAQFISASQGSDTFTNMEGLDGSAFNDTLSGDVNGNFLQGRAGNDSLQGGDGSDRLRGGAGNDTIDGGSGSGFDQVDYFAATAAVHVDLSKHGIAQVISKDEGSDALINIEDARGSAFNDTLIGDAGFNNLFGIDGNDSLLGSDGFDFLVGGKGNDTLNGGPAGDFDEASYFDSTSPIVANLSSVAHQGVAAGTVQDGTGGIDRLIGIGDILGGQGDDTMYGGATSTIFEASGGNDSIVGGTSSTVFIFNVVDYFNSSDAVAVDLTKQGQAQTISASQGKDTFVNISDVYGSAFNDTLIGDNGDNIVFGRDGNDRFAVAHGGVIITQQDVFNLFYSIEEIDLTGTGNNSLTLSALDVLQTSETGVMRILGNAGDTVNSQGQGWVPQGQTTIDGQLHDVYKVTVQGTQVTLEVETDVTHIIS